MSSSAMSRATHIALVFAALTAVTGCGSSQAGKQQLSPAPAPTPAGGRVIEISKEMIGEMAARTAWDVVLYRAPGLAIDLVGRQPAHAVVRQFAEPPLVVVDGMQAMDVRVLQLIPALHVISMRILRSGIDGVALYGQRGSGGVIEVRTR